MAHPENFLPGAPGAAPLELLKLWKHRGTFNARQFDRLVQAPVSRLLMVGMLLTSGAIARAGGDGCPIDDTPRVADEQIETLRREAGEYQSLEIESLPGEIVTELGPGPDAVYDDLDLEPRFIAILPGEEGAYRNVFGRPPGATATRKVKGHADSFLRLTGAHVLERKEQGKEALFEQIAMHATKGPVIVVGPVKIVDGRRCLVLPSSEVVPIEEIHRHADESGTQSIVVTCSSGDPALEQFASIEGAIAICGRADRVYHVLAADSTDDVTGLMVFAMRKELAKRDGSSVAITVAGIASVGGGFYYEFSRR